MTNSVFEQTCFNDVDAEFANFDYSDFTYAADCEWLLPNANSLMQGFAWHTLIFPLLMGLI